MLAFIGPLATSTATAVAAAISNLTQPALGSSTARVALSSTLAPLVAVPSPPNPAFSDWRPGQDPDAADPSDTSGNATLASTAPHDRLRNHVSLAANTIIVDGTSTPELALADAGESKVFVRVGIDGPVTMLDATDGIDQPQSVTLQDVNGDEVPDLIVANSGGNNVLVFPGLPNGTFGPEVNGGQGFTVGQDPVSVSVSAPDANGNSYLVVANRGSNSVTILDGQGQGSNWTATMGQTIDVGPSSMNAAPVKTALVDVNQDGNTDLLVCNSGSNNVYLYTNQGDGTFNTADPTVFNVGNSPSEMLVGRFDKRPELDLVTVNSGSDDLTFIGGVLTNNPTTASYSSGGIMPDAAFAIDPNHSGIMDLVVANSGDGHMALLQAGNDGLQLAGVITQAGVPMPTSLAPATGNGSGLDFFAASAGQDAALLLHFDLGTISTFLGGPSANLESNGQTTEELFAQLMPFGDSDLELVAVFWAGSFDSSAIYGEWGAREPSTITALYSPTEGQGAENSTATVDVAHRPDPSPVIPSDPSKVDQSLWARFVFGLDATLEEPRLPIDAVAARDAREAGEDRALGDFAQINRQNLLDQTFEPGFEADSGTLDEALRLLRAEGRPDEEALPVDSSPSSPPIRSFDGVDLPASDPTLETVPLISSALILSARLILKASPPRGPSSRKSPTIFRHQDV